MKQKYTVLVAEDERLIAQNIARSIETTNSLFSVTRICTNGADALDYIKEHHPNVVFTDIRMPEMDGLELAKILSSEYPFIFCVIISGYNDFKYARTAITCQVTDYLLKPINQNELSVCLSRIESLLYSQHSTVPPNSGEERQSRSPEDISNLVKEYIHSHYADQIDLSSIAASLGFSSAYLSKVFSRLNDIAPSRYLKNYRIMIAKQLLQDASLSIAVISEKTGFLDQFHFSKSFKSQIGMSPSEYRRMVE